MIFNTSKTIIQKSKWVKNNYPYKSRKENILKLFGEILKTTPQKAAQKSVIPTKFPFLSKDRLQQNLSSIKLGIESINTNKPYEKKKKIKLYFSSIVFYCAYKMTLLNINLS